MGDQDRSVGEELKLGFWRRLTGRQDPPLNRKLAYSLIVVFSVILLVCVGFYGEKILTRPDANINFHPYLKDHSALPIVITNGPKDLTNIHLDIKTCYMDTSSFFDISKLVEHEIYTYELTDEATLVVWDQLYPKYESGTCDPITSSTGFICPIKTYIVNETIYVPSQNCTRYKCGYCNYTLAFTSDQYSNDFSGTFPGPAEKEVYHLEINSSNTLKNVPPEQLTTPFSPIGFGLFSEYDWCLLNNTTDDTKCKGLPTEAIYGSPLEMFLAAKNESLGNVTFTVTQILKN